MSDQSDFEFASQFAASNEIEKAGQDILQSLHKAADVAEANRLTANHTRACATFAPRSTQTARSTR
jgi:hypothetical protein